MRLAGILTEEQEHVDPSIKLQPYYDKAGKAIGASPEVKQAIEQASEQHAVALVTWSMGSGLKGVKLIPEDEAEDRRQAGEVYPASFQLSILFNN